MYLAVHGICLTKFQVLFSGKSNFLGTDSRWMTKQLLTINLKLVLVLNIQVQNIEHFLFVSCFK